MSVEGDDVKRAIRSALDTSGVMREVKAKLRAEVFRTLDDGDEIMLPEQPREVALACELVSDFLKSMSYDNSAEVFSQESGHGSQSPLDRAYVARELGLSLMQDDGRVPLLSLIIDYLETQKKDAERQFTSGS